MPKTILLLFILAMSGCTSLELRSGTWEYQGKDIPVYKKGSEYRAYVWKRGVFELHRCDDGVFYPVSFSAFHDEYASYKEAEDWQFQKMRQTK